MIRITILLAIIAIPVVSVQAADPAPLFQSGETLNITLTGPFREIDRERDKELEYEGTLAYTEADGRVVTLDARLEVRGNYRLRTDICRHAQLWVDLRRGQVPDTLFAGQNRLKLVVQCRQQGRYEDYVVKEYLAYKLFEQLTDVGFDTRLVNVTYNYSDDEGETRTHLGLFIENKDTVAERFETETVEENRVSLSDLDPRQSTLVGLFMMMIGNTDFSLAAGPEGDECCHNAKLLTNGGAYQPIPYDFDGSGFVNASYAADPNPDFGIRNNRQRVFRGYCIHNEYVREIVPQFLEAKDAILAVVNDPRLSSRSIESGIEYLEDFYELISDPEEIQDEILDDCRG